MVDLVTNYMLWLLYRCVQNVAGGCTTATAPARIDGTSGGGLERSLLRAIRPWATGRCDVIYALLV